MIPLNLLELGYNPECKVSAGDLVCPHTIPVLKPCFQRWWYQGETGTSESEENAFQYERSSRELIHPSAK